MKWFASLLFLTATATLAQVTEPTLKVGDPAPKLQNGEWVQGDPVKQFAKGTTYIVEFWATWCGPCRFSIPHLNEIYTKYKDKGLIVIGQDCWEHDESLVAPFIKGMGSKMTYRVALDDKEGSESGKMAESWMTAAGQNGIPTAFLVDANGVIVWIGHPMGLKENVIEDAIAGKIDVAKAAEEYAKNRKNEAQLESVWAEVSQAMKTKDWDTATVKLAEMEKLLPADDRPRLEITRFKILSGRQDYAAAHKLAAQISEAHPNDADLQNELAWELATSQPVESRDLALAATIATRANEAAKGENAPILDTLARVLFMQGKKEKAIELQRKAVALTEGPMKEYMQQSLDSYKKGELPKTD
jgi:thiol-disulfide isomerase/thioredoxin